MNNEREKFKQHKKAAELGDTEAMRELAWCYQYGRGVQQDDKKAAEWRKKKQNIKMGHD